MKLAIISEDTNAFVKNLTLYLLFFIKQYQEICFLELLPLVSTSSIITNSFINFSNTTTITTRINTGTNKIALCTFGSSLTSNANYN